MRAVINAYGRALLSQFHGKILLLSIVPFILSVALWALLLGLGFQPLLDWLHGHFVEFEMYRVTTDWLVSLGLGGLRSIVVPLFALLLLLPLMIVTAMIFIGVAAMPFIVRHVGDRHFPQLEKKKGGSIFGSVVKALGAFGIFVVAWLFMSMVKLTNQRVAPTARFTTRSERLAEAWMVGFPPSPRVLP